MCELFEHYPGDPDAAVTAGTQAKDKAETLDTLEYNLAHQSDRASQQAAGEIDDSVAAAANEPRPDVSKMRAAAIVAGGVCFKFANAISLYNQGIDDLNERYCEAKKVDFGVAEDAGQKEGQSDKENDAARDKLVDAKEAELIAQLRRYRATYEEYLDTEADEAAALLKVGPTSETISRLGAQGALSNADETRAYALAGVQPAENVRRTIDQTNTVAGWGGSLPALDAFLRKLHSSKFAREMQEVIDTAGLTAEQKAAKIAKVAGAPVEEIIDVLRARRAVETTDDLVLRDLRDWVTDRGAPGPLFGSVGQKIPVFRVLARGTGKALPALGILSGGYGLYNTHENWDKLAPPDRVNGIAGGVLGIVGGAAAIAAGAAALAAAPPTLAAAGPVLGAVAIGTGIVGAASLAFEYRHEIAEWIDSRSDDVGELLGGG